MSNFREPKVISERQSSETPLKYPLPVTMIFWIAIILLSLIISLFAALSVEWWVKIPENPSPSTLLAVPSPTHTQAQSPKTSPPPVPEPAKPVAPPAPMTWKEIAQQLRQSEEMKTEVLTNTLKKSPELAPLLRPEATEPPAVTVPKIEPTISWKTISSELDHVEQQQREMLQKLFEKPREAVNSLK